MVHRSTETLLSVPQYSDLLGDQDNEDETERGQLLMASRESWWTGMAKWIGEGRAAELAKEDQDDDDITLVGNDCVSKWKQTTLAVLFGGQKERPL